MYCLDIVICLMIDNVLIYWATQEYISGSLLGIEYNNKSSINPLWVCLNVSALTTGVDSLMSDTALAIQLSDRWNDAFSKHGSTYANKYGIPSVIGSSEFTFPMLASEVLFSIELSTIISVIGFIVLLCLFTSADIGLTLLGTLAMLVIVIVSICIHEYFFPGDFDLLDIVVLIAIMGMAVDFPIHYLVEFVGERGHYERKALLEDAQNNSEAEQDNPNDDEEEEGVGDVRGTNPEYVPPDQLISSPNSTRPSIPERKKRLYPPLKSTMKYMNYSLVPPLILTFLSGFPLLYAEFQLLRKCGQYIIILAVVSYVYCIFFLAQLMPLGCRFKTWNRICIHINPEDFRPLESKDDEDDDGPQERTPLLQNLLTQEQMQTSYGSRYSHVDYDTIVMASAIVVPEDIITIDAVTNRPPSYSVTYNPQISNIVNDEHIPISSDPNESKDEDLPQHVVLDSKPFDYLQQSHDNANVLDSNPIDYLQQSHDSANAIDHNPVDQLQQAEDTPLHSSAMENLQESHEED